jgi:hypothetical protein
LTTEYANKVDILHDLWINHSDNGYLSEFVELNDLGLPLSYLIAKGIVESTTLAEQLVNASFSDLLELFDVEDTGFTSLDQIVKNN